MATFIGKLKLESSQKEYKIVRCQTHFMRHYNAHFPDANPICDKIKLTITVNDTRDMSIQDWYINQVFQSCEIYYDVVSEKEGLDYQRCLNIKDAQCYSMQEVYDKDMSTHELNIEIVPASLKIYAIFDGCIKEELSNEEIARLHLPRKEGLKAVHVKHVNKKANGEVEFIHP